MATRDMVKSVFIACAFLVLICWNVLLQTKYHEHDRSLRAQDDQFRVHANLIKSVDKATSRRIKRSLSNKPPPTGGATYIRWGRTECPDDAELVYKGKEGMTGYMAGEGEDHTGGAAEYVCLSGEPKYARYTTDAKDSEAWIQGVELDIDDSPNILETTNSKLSPLDDSDPKCAVCRSLTRTSMVMIPGTNDCIPGWNMEYWGYLMTGVKTSKAQHSYICFDKAPEAGTDGGASNDNEVRIQFVQGKCGSLPCTPYVKNYELTCVVCTK